MYPELSYRDNSKVLVNRTLFGRTIQVARLPENCLAFCDDCQKKAKFLVVETNGEFWFYCGECEVGG